jgi:hypothetical protein
MHLSLNPIPKGKELQTRKLNCDLLVEGAVVQLVWMRWVCGEGAYGIRGRAGTARAGKGGLRP